MNALSIMQKLYIVENNPQLIWNAIEQCYGEGFFHKIIEKEYGITPDFQEKTNKYVIDEINLIKYDSEDKIKQISSFAQEEVKRLTKLMRE